MFVLMETSCFMLLCSGGSIGFSFEVVKDPPLLHFSKKKKLGKEEFISLGKRDELSRQKYPKTFLEPLKKFATFSLAVSYYYFK